MTIENTVEGIFVTALSAISYISTNSIPVLNWRDADQEAVFPCVVVKADPIVAEYCKRMPLVICNLMITAATYTADDKDMTAINALADALQDYVLNFTESSLNSNGLLFKGSLYEMGQIEVMENVQVYTIHLENHIEITSTT